MGGAAERKADGSAVTDSRRCGDIFCKKLRCLNAAKKASQALRPTNGAVRTNGRFGQSITFSYMLLKLFGPSNKLY